MGKRAGILLSLKMLSRTIRRSLLDTGIPSSALPPTFLLPNRARYFQTTTQHVESPAASFEASQLPTTVSRAPVSVPPRVLTKRTVPPPPATHPSPYVSAHIHGKPYLVTVGDMVRLPFHMPGVVPGDVLRLNRASSLGSRDYTLKGTPYVDERLFECRARVMGVEAEPMRIKEKTKRRNRKIKTVRSKLKFTILRISDLKIKTLEEIEQ